MIFGAGLILTLAAVCLLVFNAPAGVLLTVVVKPVIDATWEHSFMGLNCLEIIGTTLPMIMLFRIFVVGDGRGTQKPLIWFAYLVSNSLSVAVVLSSGKVMGSLDLLFRTLNGFVGYFMFQTYVKDRNDFRKLVIAFLLAGLFPMSIGLFQAVTGKVWRMALGTGGVIRYTGLYHDIVSVRQYAFMTMTGVLLYWSYFAEHTLRTKTLLTAYAVTCSVVLFKAYSKAGIIICVLWFVIWTVHKKKYIWLVALPALLVVLNLATGGKIVEEVQTVFSKETAAVEGTGETAKVLAGRSVVWEGYLNKWERKDVFYKVFGSGTSAGNAHNDFLRVLIGGGFIGLITYVLLLLIMGFKTLFRSISDPSDLNTMAVMIFLMWIVDCIGLVPGLYPGYQWYVWGVIGLALRGVPGLEKGPETGAGHGKWATSNKAGGLQTMNRSKRTGESSAI